MLFLAFLVIAFLTGEASLVVQLVKNPPAVQETTCTTEDQGSIPGSGRSPEKEMVTHSSILAWGIQWTEEPGRLYSMGSQESDMT